MLMASERRTWAGRAALALCLLGAVVTVFHRELGFFVAPDPRLLLDVRDDIRNYEDVARWPARFGRFENEGFVPCVSGQFVESGWCLAPGHRGRLRYILPTPADSRALLVRLFFFKKAPQAGSRLVVSRQGDPQPRLVFDHPYFADARLDLSSVLSAPGGDVVLSFEGENPTAASDVVVQYFEARLFAEPLPRSPGLGAMVLAILAIGCCLLPLAGWRWWLPLWAIITLGFALRYYALTQVLYLHPDLDAEGYQLLAKRMQLFSATGFFTARFGPREPLFVLIVQVALWLLGDAETHVRLISFFASLLAIGLTARVAAKMFGRPLGLVGALVMAVCLPLVRESVRGLRLEVELVLLLILVETVFLSRFRFRWRRAVLAGIIGGVLALLRTNYLVNLVPLFLFAFVRRQRSTWWAAALAVGLMVILPLPHRVNGHRVHGSWSWDNNTRWWANIEFAGRPGWPTKLEMWRDTEGQQPRMTAFEYFFRLHTIPELMVGTLRGLWKIVRHMQVVAFYGLAKRRLGIELGWLDGGFQVLGIVGLLLAGRDPRLRWLPVVWLCVLWHLPFLYDRALVEPWRHTYHAFPFFVLGALAAVSRVARRTSPAPIDKVERVEATATVTECAVS